MEIAALSILILLFLIGFVCIFFTTFGTLIIFLGAFAFAAMTEFTLIDVPTLIIIFALYLLGEVLEYLLVVVGAKKFGASNWAIAGAIVGGIVGAILGAAFFGVGVILGTFLGLFFGAFFVELFRKRDFVKAVLAGTGAFVGRLGSIAAKVVISIAILEILLKAILVEF